MNGISMFLRVFSLVMACVSCATAVDPPEATTSARLAPPVPIKPWFQSAIATRDEGTSLFFGRLGAGKDVPSGLTIRYLDSAGKVLESVASVVVQGDTSGIVYAAPKTVLSGTAQDNLKNAVSAQVVIGLEVQSIDLGQAQGTISSFTPGYYGPEYGVYSGCPDCLAYFLCHCLEDTDGVTLDQALSVCPVSNTWGRPCRSVDQIEPFPW